MKSNKNKQRKISVQFICETSIAPMQIHSRKICIIKPNETNFIIENSRSETRLNTSQKLDIKA